MPLIFFLNGNYCALMFYTLQPATMNFNHDFRFISFALFGNHIFFRSSMHHHHLSNHCGVQYSAFRIRGTFFPFSPVILLKIGMIVFSFAGMFPHSASGALYLPVLLVHRAVNMLLLTSMIFIPESKRGEQTAQRSPSTGNISACVCTDPTARKNKADSYVCES